jgi:MazG family protein
MRDSTAAKSIRTQLESKQKAYQAEISKKEEEMQKEEQSLSSQRETLSKEAFEKKVDAFRTKATTMQKDVQGKKATLEGVPSSLPPMVKAIRIQAKARGTGFDWENKDQVWDKVKEEILEFEQAETEEEREKEFGDLIFSLINYARFVKIEPEQALEKTNLKFIRRFNYLEEKIKASGKTLDEADITTMDQFWDEAKGKGL